MEGFKFIQEITLDIFAKNSVVINAKQGDGQAGFVRVRFAANGTVFKAEKTWTVSFRARKRDGHGIWNPAEIEESGTILFELTRQTLACPGMTPADVNIKMGEASETTLTFWIDVELAATGDNMTSKDEFKVLNDATKEAKESTGRANDAAALIENMTVSASKVAAGGTPTAKLTKQDDHYDLTLGLVTGDKGNKGDKGDTPTISIAETVTGAPGDPAKVENIGTTTDPKLKFTIPLGNQGPVSRVNGGTGDIVIGERNYWSIGRQTLTDISYDYKSGIYTAHDEDTSTRLSFKVQQYTAENSRTSVEFLIPGSEILQSVNGVGIFEITLTIADGAKSIRFANAGTKKEFSVWQLIPPNLGTGDVVTLRINILDPTIGHCIFCDLSLTKGNVATDWTPAPEDKQDVPTVYTVTLPANAWSDGQQTVKDARFIDGDNIDWDVDVNGACIPWDGITITEGQMTVKADIVPTTAVTFTVKRSEVRHDG